MTSKSNLNLYCQKSHLPTPCYTTERIEDGFISTVTVKIVGLGSGMPECYKSQRPQTTKKAAENDAATVAVDSVVQKHPSYSTIGDILDWLDSQAATNSTKKRSGNRQQCPQQVVATTPEQQSLQSQVSIQPPVGVPPGLRQIPTSSSPHLPQSQITVQGPLGPSSIRAHPQQQSNVPMDRPWDRHHGKPSSAHIVSSYSPKNSTPTSPRSPTGVPNFNKKSKHQKMLEEYCEAHGLPVPKYSVRQDEKYQYTAVVTVGDMEFPTAYLFDSFEKAKDNATLLAIAGIGVSLRNLTIAETGQQQPTPSPASSLQPSTQPTISKSQPCRSTAQQSMNTGLQPPSYFQNSFQQMKLQGQLTLNTASHATGTLSTAPDLRMSSLEPGPTRQQAPSTVDIMPPLETQSVRTPQEQQPKVDLQLPHANCKQILNEYCFKNRFPAPHYEVEYPEDSVGYISTVTVLGKRFSSPPLSSKKRAENFAAAEAVKALGILTQGKEKEVGMTSTVQTLKSVASTRAVNGESQPSKTGTESFVSFKNLLQEHLQKTKAALPYYETISGEEGYVSTVSVQQPSGGQARRFTSGGHSVKKAAEQEAARIACTEMGLLQMKSL